MASQININKLYQQSQQPNWPQRRRVDRTRKPVALKINSFDDDIELNTLVKDPPRLRQISPSLIINDIQKSNYKYVRQSFREFDSLKGAVPSSEHFGTLFSKQYLRQRSVSGNQQKQKANLTSVEIKQQRDKSFKRLERMMQQELRYARLFAQAHSSIVKQCSGEILALKELRKSSFYEFDSRNEKLYEKKDSNTASIPVKNNLSRSLIQSLSVLSSPTSTTTNDLGSVSDLQRKKIQCDSTLKRLAQRLDLEHRLQMNVYRSDPEQLLIQKQECGQESPSKEISSYSMNWAQNAQLNLQKVSQSYSGSDSARNDRLPEIQEGVLTKPLSFVISPAKFSGPTPFSLSPLPSSRLSLENNPQKKPIIMHNYERGQQIADRIIMKNFGLKKK